MGHVFFYYLIVRKMQTAFYEVIDMKIYVGGSKNIDILPECVRVRLKELAGEKDEFIMGANAGADVLFREFLSKDAKASVNVYIPEDEDVSYDGVNVTHFKPRYDDEDDRRTYEEIFMHGSFVFPDADYSLLKDAEYGLFLWDGESLRTFMNVLEMVWYEKPVEVYLVKTGNIYKIEKAEDLKELVDKPGEDYVGKWDIIHEKYLDMAVSKCMTSKDMRDFYLGSEVYKNTVADMILSSPVSLQEKLEVLDALSVTDDRFYELVLRVCKGERSNWCDGVEGFYYEIHDGLFGYHAEVIRESLNELELKPGESFMLKKVSYIYPAINFKRCETEDLRESSDYETALEFLREYIKQEKISNDSMCWFVLEKRVPVNEPYVGREFDTPYSFYFIKDRPVSFCKNSQRDDGSWYEPPDYFRINMLNLYTPYSTGDIVKIDNRPFDPLTYVLMLENGYDSQGFKAGGRALFRNKEGKWSYHYIQSYRPDNCNYIHNTGFPSYYGLSEYDGELPEEFAVMKELQKTIGGDAAKGKLLLEHLKELEEEEYIIGITDEVINEFAKSDWVNISEEV